MKRFVVGCLLVTHLVAHAAPPVAPASFDLQGIRVAEVVQLIYGSVLKTPYVIDPEVLADARPVSFRFGSTQGDMSAFVRVFLASLGYGVEQHAGVDFIAKRRDAEVPKPAPEVFVYRPQYRNVAYLSRVLQPLFKGSFAANRGIHAPDAAKPDGAVPETSAAALIDQDADVLVFAGIPSEIAQLQKLLPQVDQAIGEVAVRGVVYEVSNGEKTGSAFGLLATALGGKVTLGLGTKVNLGNYIQLKNTALEAIYSSLANDSRFKVISSPSLRIQSGSRGSFSVGQDVPVLGALSFPQGAGQAVQSVEYRSSGVIFDIRPTVRDSIIELHINQQLSNFVTTTTGVNSSPTLTKRELKTSVGLQDGDVIVLGGLTENKESHSRDGLSFLPRFFDTKGHEQSSTEILLVLQVQKVQ